MFDTYTLAAVLEIIKEYKSKGLMLVDVERRIEFELRRATVQAKKIEVTGGLDERTGMGMGVIGG